VPTASSTVVTLSRSGGVKHLLAAAVSVLLGVFGIVWAAVGQTNVVTAVLGGLLVLAGVALAYGSKVAADRLVFDADAVARNVGPRNLWRLRWQHMAAVRFGRTHWEDEVPEGQEPARDALWLVPLTAVADHPQIAPALQPRPIDGIMQPTFEVPLGLDPKVWDAVHDAVRSRAPAQLLND
jgi:hypothetical protein